MQTTVTRIRADVPEPWWNFVVALAAVALGVALALLVHRILYGILVRIARASEMPSDDIVIARLRTPTRWAMIALGLVLAARETPLLGEVWQRIAGFVMPALIGWIALTLFRAFVEAACTTSDPAVFDDLRMRRRRTRLAIFSHIVTFIVIFITVGLMLLSIPGVREVGVTLMASAGIAGLAVGAAAQPALKSLIAGLQMAFTEPISIGDLVTIDGQTGTVEDIRSTYVIVRTWDERRLVVPTSKFLDNTFENWTRGGAQMSGPAFLHLDPTTEIPPLRAEFDRLTEQHPLWDKRDKSLQVTNTAAGSIEVRFVVSAANSGDLHNLRCDLREALLAWIRDHQPLAIPRQRTDAVELE
jgi:small-conductance mechanosensitive channel